MATGITENDVWKAADALLLEGQRPTIERVRQKIGRGSPNTVQPHLDSWFRGLGARIRDPQAFAAPSSAPDPVTQVAEHLWQVALSEARASVEQDYATRMAELVSERARIDEERHTFRENEQAAKARFEAALAERDLLASQVEDLRQREAAAELALSGANAHVSQLSESLRTARIQLDEERAGFDRERRDLQEQSRQQESHWLVEIDRLRQALREARNQVEAAERRARETEAGLVRRAFDAESRLGLLQEAHARAQGQIAEQTDRLSCQDEMLASLNTKFHDALIRTATLEQSLRDMQRAQTARPSMRRKVFSGHSGKWLKRRTRQGEPKGMV